MEKSVIMIVDDDVSYNELLATMVKRSGHSPYQVFNGKEAIDAVKNLNIRPALVLCDIKMPEMNGIEFVKENIDKNYNLNICMITGQLDRAALLEALQLGAIDFMTKPIQLDKFNEKIQRLLKQ